MTRYFCDACGREVSEGDRIWIQAILNVRRYLASSVQGFWEKHEFPGSYDRLCCPGCFAELHAKLKELLG